MPYLVGLLVVIMLTLGWVGSSSVDKVADLTEELYDHPLVVSTAVLRIYSNVFVMERAIKDIILSESQEASYQYRGIINRTEDAILVEFGLVEDRYMGDIEAVRIARRSFLAWKPIRDEVIRLAMEGKRSEAAFISQTRGVRQTEEIEAKIQVLRDFARSKSVEFLAAAKETRSKTIRFVWLSLACALILAGFVGPQGGPSRSGPAGA